MARQVGVSTLIAAVCVAMTLSLSGVALMLWAATGVVHWLLWAVPLAPVGIAALVVVWPFAAATHLVFNISVQQQVERDLQLFKEIF
ncbi:MAG: hypothetical protein ABW049_12895 [Spongiibacteraceae bacterium]